MAIGGLEGANGYMNSEYSGDIQNASSSQLQLADEALIALAKSGDSEAYTKLYQRHAKRVFHKILRMTGNREDAEDVLQEATIKALIHLNGFEGRSTFSTWLTQIAINAALMIRRKRTSRPEQSIEIVGDSGSSAGGIQVADRSPSAEDQLHRDERDHQIRRAIERLPPILRTSLELQLAEDLPVRELSIRLGISVPATKSRLMRARNQVGRSLLRIYRVRPTVAILHRQLDTRVQHPIDEAKIC